MLCYEVSGVQACALPIFASAPLAVSDRCTRPGPAARPAIRLNSVDFPAALGPMTAVRCPPFNVPVLMARSEERRAGQGWGCAGAARHPRTTRWRLNHDGD